MSLSLCANTKNGQIGEPTRTLAMNAPQILTEVIVHFRWYCIPPKGEENLGFVKLSVLIYLYAEKKFHPKG